MASLQILSSNCAEPGCEARATRRLIDKDGKEVATYCAAHGNKALVALAKAEGGRGRA
jgi:hypothetical protein